VAIAPFMDDKPAAISFTFDDGIASHVERAAPLLNQFHMPATFYVVAGKMRQHKSDPLPVEPRFRFGEATLCWDEVRQLAADGHEIGNHSLSHFMFTRLTDAKLAAREIEESRQRIEKEIGHAPTTFAFPYNEYNDGLKDAVLMAHAAVRENWTDFGGKTFTTRDANTMADDAARERRWLVPMIHGIDGGFLPLSTSVFREHLAYLNAHRDKFWIDTYERVNAYRALRQNAEVEVTDATERGLTFSLRVDVPNAVTPMPLTAVINLPPDATPTVMQDDKPLPFTVRKNTLLINVEPNAAPVTVSW